MMSYALVAEQFEKNGFAVLEDVFSSAELEDISREVDRVIDGKASYMPAVDIVYEPNSSPPRVRNAFRLHIYNKQFLAAAKHANLIGPLSELLGQSLRLYGSQVFAKPAHGGTAVPAHQDMPYWPFEPYEMISAWIALDDSTVENGCVRYLPVRTNLACCRTLHQELPATHSA
jgi:ectoine hydroxylase-related dioxygenase (phytanoyl-CoA dioxygenase family)